jgi:microcystin-dependent protein
MAEPFLAEVRIMSFIFAPKGWATCNGQLLPINQNQALFSLLGTTFGGDGRVNFGLPDMRGRTPIAMGAGYTLGERAGEYAHTLTQQEMPAHNHFVNTSNAAATLNAVSNTAVLGSVSSGLYSSVTQLTTLAPSSISNYGGSQAHNNTMPSLVLNFCIALQGIFPSQT